MPMPKIADEWSERVLQAAAENPGARARVLSRLLKDRFGEPEGFPSEKTVHRILTKQWDNLPPEARQDYFSLRWPGSMISGALPWEAAPAALELLRLLSGFGRPPIRLAKWWWRVSVAVPDAPPAIRLSVAQQLASQEVAQGRDLLPDASIEMYLILTPWESDEAQDRYRAACEAAGVKPFSHPTVDLRPGADLDTIVEAIAIQFGHYPKGLKEKLKQQQELIAPQGFESVSVEQSIPPGWYGLEKKEDDSEERQ